MGFGQLIAELGQQHGEPNGPLSIGAHLGVGDPCGSSFTLIEIGLLTVDFTSVV